MAEIMATAPISEIMTKEVITADEKDSLNSVVDLFKKYRIRHIPIVTNQEVIGIVSRSDINRLTFGALFDADESTDDAILSMLSIAQVMTANPTTVALETPIRNVAQIFANSEFHALPVVVGHKIVGIVTTTDIIRYMLKYC